MQMVAPLNPSEFQNGYASQDEPGAWQAVYVALLSDEIAQFVTKLG